MVGLEMFYENQLEKKQMGKVNSKKRVKAMIDEYKYVFKKLLQFLELSDIHKPFIAKIKGPLFNSDLNLANPKAKATVLILWLYSIEPPFYAALN